MPIGAIYDPPAVPPMLPAPSWNGNYIGSNTYWARLDAGYSADMFWHAIRERAYASNVRVYFGGVRAPPMPLSGDNALGEYELLRTTIVDLAQFFVRRYQDDGTSNYWPEGQAVVDSCIRHPNSPGLPFTPIAANTQDSITFPPPNKFSRRFHRLIYSLSAPGTNGERAKFIYFSPFGGENFTGVRTTDPNFNVHLVTPAGEQSNDGKFFVRTAGVWVLSADQKTPADIIEETGVTQRYRGDLHDAKLANELRDVMNMLARTIGFYHGGGYEQGPRIGVLTPSFIGDLDQSNVYGGKQKGNGSTISAADADAQYAASPITNTGRTAFSVKAMDHWTFGDNLPHRWSVSNGEDTFNIPSHPTLDSMPNPLGQTRNIHFFVVTQAMTNWDTQGVSDLVQDTWHEKAPSSSTSNTAVTGPKVGDVTIPPPNWPVPNALGDGQKGWTLGFACVILDWEVSGGFQYSKVTP